MVVVPPSAASETPRSIRYSSSWALGLAPTLLQDKNNVWKLLQYAEGIAADDSSGTQRSWVVSSSCFLSV